LKRAEQLILGFVLVNAEKVATVDISSYPSFTIFLALIKSEFDFTTIWKLAHFKIIGTFLSPFVDFFLLHTQSYCK
jgi:hypothetical protein